ncbi:MAG: YhdP family protein [Burkholderiaceae bacterium]
MNQSDQASLKFWKITATLSKLLLGLAVAAWLMFALAWMALHWVIVPRIGELRPRLEIEASKVLGVPVKIGDISAKSVGIIPSFELKDIALLDSAGREALKLPRILASVSPASLLRFSAEQILIESPELNIRRDVQGKLTIAGLDFSKDDKSSGGADWFFSQPEFAIRNGMVHWVDEMPNGALGVPPPLTLSQVDFVSRNPLNKHELRLDATPPVIWGDRFSLRGLFAQSLLSTDKGKFKDWTGQIYTDFSKIDVSEISRYVKLNGQSGRGVGVLKAWTSFTNGEWASTTADVSLAQVDATLGKGLEPLALQSMSGRLIGRKLKQGFEASTQNLQFQTRDGLRWPGGNMLFSQTNPTQTEAAVADGAIDTFDATKSINDFKADKLDLAVISLIANKIPLGASTHELITSLAPKGVIESISAHWQGYPDAPQELKAKGVIKGVQISAKSSSNQVGEGIDKHESAGRPGFRGASIDFDVTSTGGKAKIAIDKGAIDLPGLFDDAIIPVDQLSADIVWRITPAPVKGKASTSVSTGSATADSKIDVSVSNLSFKNADAKGTAQLTWKTSDPATASNKSRFPGVLDLNAKLTDAELSKVSRYLPIGIPKKAREYVQDLLIEGKASEVDFKIKGGVWDIPAAKANQGDFKITAKFNNARIAYVPKKLQDSSELPWPELNKVAGEMVLDRTSLSVKSTRSEVVGLPGIAIAQSVVTIPDLSATVVNVTAQGKSPLTDLLGFVNKSPLYGMTNQSLSKATSTGLGDFKVELSLATSDFTKTRVKGDIAFLGNDVRMTPLTPLIGQAKGLLRFTEKGFLIQDAQAVMFGDAVRFDGGNLRLNDPTLTPTGRGVVINGQGVASALGLQRASELSFIPQIAKNATGSTAYTAQLRFVEDQTEVSVQTNLQGMGINLPIPFNKPSQSIWPLRFENTLVESSIIPERDGKVRLKDNLRLTIDKIADFKLVRDISGAVPKVIRGTMSVGLDAGEGTPEPSNAVAANINVDRLDVDEWTKFVTSIQGSAVGTAAKAGVKAASNQNVFDDLIPSSMAIRAKELIIEGRKFENIVIGGSREGSVWRANMEAKQLSGYVEYRQSTPAQISGRIYARLARLVIGEAQVKDVEKLLDEQPVSIPALDLVVEDFELRGRKFGKIEIDAVNRLSNTSGSVDGARVWRLNRLNVTMPEAKLTANGFWAYRETARTDAVSKGDAAGLLNTLERRTTGIDFKLDIADAGQLLERFGFNGVVRAGKGKLEGQMTWRGSPLAMNYPTLAGQFNINVDNGQFLKVEPGVAKLLSVLSMQSIAKRLTLDFRDVFSEGFVFDFLRGDVTIDRGLATTNNMQISGVNAVILMDGKSDIAAGTQDIRVVYAPEVNAGVASLLVASAINPAIGLGTFLAQLFLRQPLIEAVTKEFKVSGTWSEPVVTEVKRTSRADVKK